MTAAERVRESAERAARTSYGRLLALLAAGDGDIAGAEDALADAFERALTTWPRNGVPENPEGWLLTVARNRRRDHHASAAQRRAVPLTTAATDRRPAYGASGLDDLDPDAIGDKRLELLFVCAHPAIEPAVRAPLMLQTVLGFDAATIAGAFATAGPTMAQRLVRAKRRIRAAGIPFAIPSRTELPARLPAVLEAVYGCFAIDWRAIAGPTVRESMAHEALHLARTLATLLPVEAEVRALAALVALTLARRRGEPFVPLEEAQPADWDATLVAEGEEELRAASRLRVRTGARIGRFELEAAVCSAHAVRAAGREPDAAAIVTLHRALVAVAPTLGARVALAAAVARVEGPVAGLDELERIDDAGLERFQPAWATRAALLTDAGRSAEAAAAYERAIALCADRSVRDWLMRRRDAVG